MEPYLKLFYFFFIMLIYIFLIVCIILVQLSYPLTDFDGLVLVFLGKWSWKIQRICILLISQLFIYVLIKIDSWLKLPIIFSRLFNLSAHILTNLQKFLIATRNLYGLVIHQCFITLTVIVCSTYVLMGLVVERECIWGLMRNSNYGLFDLSISLFHYYSLYNSNKTYR